MGIVINLRDYVVDNFGDLMTEHEKAVILHLMCLSKERHERPSPGTATDIKRGGPDFSRDPAVIADAQAGWHQARERIAQRILRDNPDRVYFNKCPKCGALARYLRARVCPTCGHTWFHVPRDQRL